MWRTFTDRHNQLEKYLIAGNFEWLQIFNYSDWSIQKCWYVILGGTIYSIVHCSNPVRHPQYYSGKSLLSVCYIIIAKLTAVQ